jgi:hypothetical protein
MAFECEVLHHRPDAAASEPDLPEIEIVVERPYVYFGRLLAPDRSRPKYAVSKRSLLVSR